MLHYICMGRKRILVIVFIIIAFIAGFAGYSTYQKNQLKKATSDWKIYSDNFFSFKYPGAWILNTYGKGENLFDGVVSLTDPSNGNQTGVSSITILFYENQKQLSLEDYEAEEVKKYSPEAQRTRFYHASAINTILGNAKALLLEEEDCEPSICDVYVLNVRDMIYQILVRYDFVNRSSIKQILSTFNFIE